MDLTLFKREDITNMLNVYLNKTLAVYLIELTNLNRGSRGGRGGENWVMGLGLFKSFPDDLYHLCISH